MRCARCIQISLLALVACSSSSLPEGATAFSGTGCYQCCFETSTFVADPPTNSEFWWVESPPRAFDEAFEKMRRTYPTNDRSYSASVRVQGSVGPPGQYGHMGGATRLLEIREFSEMRPHPGGCPIIIPPELLEPLPSVEGGPQ